MAQRQDVLKLLMLGESGVGKSMFLKRIAEDDFSNDFSPTIGIDFKNLVVDLDDEDEDDDHSDDDGIKIQLWDLPGKEEYRTIATAYFDGTHGVLLMYDVTDRHSFDSIRNWIHLIDDKIGTHVSIILVGNKCDEFDNQVVSTKEGQRLAREFNIQFYECSSQANENLQAAVEGLVKVIQERREEERVVESEQVGPGFFQKIAFGWNSWTSSTSSTA
eukprot:scaffold89584_cov51-Attheya_sp.AAC.3